MQTQRDASGFTLLEVTVVCAIVGVLSMIAYPNMVRFSEQQNTKASATQMAGVLDTARSRAVTEATPHLVYINPKVVNGNGECGPVATIVRDSDRSYTISAGDQIRDIEPDPGTCKSSHPVGEGNAVGEAEISLPDEDLAIRVIEVKGSKSGEGSSSEPASAKLVEVVVNGSTFPLDANSGLPVIAFSERGIPVDPSDPTNWGGGAGAVYVTDQHGSVYAIVVRPLGDVNVQVYDQVKGSWR